jgi:type IV pilus assembly protein PilC
VKAALTYPGIVAGAAVLIISILIIFVIPKFAAIFAESGISLPLITRILFNLGNTLLKNIFFILIGLIAIVWALYYYFQRTERGKWERDKLMLRLPIVGSLLHKVALSRFTTTLGTLTGSGVPILEALEIVSKTAGNKVIEKTIDESRARIREGEKIGEVLRTSPVFPPLVTQMISVGEGGGCQCAIYGLSH